MCITNTIMLITLLVFYTVLAYLCYINLSLMNTQITIGSTVKYRQPMADEIGLTFTVIEIDYSTNWVKLQANVDMNVKPVYVANITDVTPI